MVADASMDRDAKKQSRPIDGGPRPEIGRKRGLNGYALVSLDEGRTGPGLTQVLRRQHGKYGKHDSITLKTHQLYKPWKLNSQWRIQATDFSGREG